MNFISAIPEQLHSIILLVLVLLSKYLLQSVAPHNPWRFFSFFCQQLALKVNKAENGEQQQQISGFVAVIVTFSPLWIILWLFGDFVEVAWLWQGFLLYMALGTLSIKRDLTQIIKAISASNNYRAKQLLQPLVLRDTKQLSPMGIAKASIEMLVLKHLQQTITTILLFICFDALVAISFRMLLEMHYAWNQKRSAMRFFGQFANLLVQLTAWLPARLFLLSGLVLSFGQQSTLLWRLSMPHFFSLNNGVLLQFFAIALNIKLCGVAIYDGNKLRRTEYNPTGRPPELQDIVRGYQFIDRINFFAVIILTACCALWWAISNQTTL
ncbi:cobalamin biosynthesis protein CbiB [Thalassotalea sp. M1531]|uniref:Cobalamin biosynthesis protein CbiB n=1 Tax=Thalassotalea algicola TaxID=2716224 RepID=A0A7Y0Q623_9GAMM|nr:cobalamin biosynthesis protein [Thalassotalea algicola]NMP30347.1 cobalamin biosynthesis protein CbiB [Thalassotalea algicola]